jgi:dihydrofolate synthase / folylpolyglutamate synthase
MRFIPVKTRKFLPPKDDILAEMDKRLPKLKEGDVLMIASKILAIHQGYCVKVGSADLVQKHKQKRLLTQKEADYSLPGYLIGKSQIILTIKDYTLIPSAGIDESNGNGYFILWPKNVNVLLKQIVKRYQKKFGIKKLAAVAVDSRTMPLRWGTQGVSIGFWGLNPLYDYRGKKDIFKRKLVYTQRNLVDTLADLGALVMGEGGEQTPAVVLRGAKFVKFTTKDLYHTLVIPPKKDLYAPILKPFWKKKRK